METGSEQRAQHEGEDPHGQRDAEALDRARAELDQAKQYLENILAYMGEALLVLDPQGTIREVNPATRRMLGYTETELCGMSIGDVFEEEGEEQADPEAVNQGVPAGDLPFVQQG